MNEDTIVGLFGEGVSEEDYRTFIEEIDRTYGKKVAHYFDDNTEAVDGEFYFNESLLMLAFNELVIRGFAR